MQHQTYLLRKRAAGAKRYALLPSRHPGGAVAGVGWAGLALLASAVWRPAFCSELVSAG